MRWKTGRRSSNVEDRRGVRMTGGKMKGGGIGIILLVLVGMYFGIDPSVILNSNLVDGGGPTQQIPMQTTPEEDRLADFVSVVLADTEDTWSAIFREEGGVYVRPKLVLFSEAVQSACGTAYCVSRASRRAS